MRTQQLAQVFALERVDDGALRLAEGRPLNLGADGYGVWLALWDRRMNPCGTRGIGLVRRQTEVGLADDRFGRQRDRSLDDVLQLAHVPRPRVRGERLRGLR